ncbi:hypothetical protein C1O63_1061 [Dehalococcoides mccartyi]|nr:hypothetical protein C1O63_1061 [Dehalococcoides mccartyi]
MLSDIDLIISQTRLKYHLPFCCNGLKTVFLRLDMQVFDFKLIHRQ